MLNNSTIFSSENFLFFVNIVLYYLKGYISIFLIFGGGTLLLWQTLKKFLRVILGGLVAEHFMFGYSELLHSDVEKVILFFIMVQNLDTVWWSANCWYIYCVCETVGEGAQVAGLHRDWSWLSDQTGYCGYSLDIKSSKGVLVEPSRGYGFGKISWPLHWYNWENFEFLRNIVIILVGRGCYSAVKTCMSALLLNLFYCWKRKLWMERLWFTLSSFLLGKKVKDAMEWKIKKELNLIVDSGQWLSFDVNGLVPKLLPLFQNL